MPAWKAATFDCYGTLIDWEGGAAAFLYDVARRNGDDDPGPGHLLRRRWEEIQFEHIQQDYRSYNVRARGEPARVGGRARLPLERERGLRLRPLDAVAGSRSPTPSRRSRALREAGVPLAIVSNSESAIMDHTLRQLAPLEFDHVVLADEVRCYKPDRRPFTRMLDKLSAAPEDVLHVAFGFKYDIGRAQELGMQTAWINRHREPLPDPDTVPDHEWRDLWGLAELAERD